jgi:hypothetical protein
MASYDELKKELVEISKIVEKFPETVKPEVYNLLVEQFLGIKLTTGPDSETINKANPAVQKRATAKKKAIKPNGRTKKASANESYSIDRNLDLRGDGSLPSFKDFFAEKSPSGAKQINTVSVYYLKKIMGLTIVTLDQVYTCYSEVKKKPPKAFKQSFSDTKNREGWIEFDSGGNLDIPHRGTVYVEHDLPQVNEKE